MSPSTLPPFVSNFLGCGEDIIQTQLAHTCGSALKSLNDHEVCRAQEAGQKGRRNRKPNSADLSNFDLVSFSFFISHQTHP